MEMEYATEYDYLYLTSALSLTQPMLRATLVYFLNQPHPAQNF
jgi:hypothetical protein